MARVDRFKGIGGNNKARNNKPLPNILMRKNMQNELPTSYQGMKDYVRMASKELERSFEKIQELQDAITILKPRIKSIEKIMEQVKNGDTEDEIK